MESGSQWLHCHRSLNLKGTVDLRSLLHASSTVLPTLEALHKCNKMHPILVLKDLFSQIFLGMTVLKISISREVLATLIPLLLLWLKARSIRRKVV